MSKRIILVGGGGHCKVIIDAIKESGTYEIAGIIDPEKKNVLGIDVIGDDTALDELFKAGVGNAFIALGSIGDTSSREKLYNNAKEIGFSFPVIIHPSAVIAKDVLKNIGEGTFVAASATVNPGTTIGRNVIINTSSSIDHDCEIGDFSHIAPGVILSGDVKVGRRVHIGTGSNISNGSEISEGKFIKAGSLVYKDESGKTVAKTMIGAGRDENVV